MAHIESIIQKIENRYDPEFDINPSGPRVTWAEAELAEAVKTLLARVVVLENELATMKKSGPTPRALDVGVCACENVDEANRGTWLVCGQCLKPRRQ